MKYFYEKKTFLKANNSTRERSCTIIPYHWFYKVSDFAIWIAKKETNEAKNISEKLLKITN